MYHSKILLKMKVNDKSCPIELNMYNVLFEDHTQFYVCAATFGKAASAAYLLHSDKLIAITYVKSVNVVI